MAKKVFMELLKFICTIKLLMLTVPGPLQGLSDIILVKYYASLTIAFKLLLRQ